MIDKRILKETIDLWENELDEKLYWKSNKEKDFENHVIAILTEAGFIVLKLPDETTDYTLPDLLCHGHSDKVGKVSFYIECKKPRGQLSPRQKESFGKLDRVVDIYVIKNGKHWVKFLNMCCDEY